MKETLLASASNPESSLPRPVMVIIALLLLMLPYLIYRYTGKSVTEYLRFSVLTGWINRKGEALRERFSGKKRPAKISAGGKNGDKKPDRTPSRHNAQADYLKFISRLLDFSRKNRLFSILPGNILHNEEAASLTAVLVTKARVIGVMAYAFEGEVIPAKNAAWQVVEDGETRPVGNLAEEGRHQLELLKGAMQRIGLSGIPCEVMLVFTGNKAVLPADKPAGVMKAEAFFEQCSSRKDLQEGTLSPAETGRKLSLCRKGKKSR